jgi:PAS domain S-box-containing protein
METLLYTANFINLNSYDLSNKFDSCILTISVGQNVHEGEKFKATLNLINKNFKKCTIGVCDTLQRHSIAMLAGLEGDVLHEIAKKDGDQWIDRNIEYCKKYLAIPFEIIRWDSWLRGKKYTLYRERVNFLYNTDKVFVSIIEKLAIEFNNRLKKRDYNLNEEKGLKLSAEYLLEECAVMSIWYEEGYSVDVYPAIRNEAIEYCFSAIMSQYYNHLLLPAGVNFKKNNRQDSLVSGLVMQKILDIMPGHVYWKDINGKFLGCNKRQAENYGFKNIYGLIGKEDKDFLKEEIAKEIKANDKKIITTRTEQLIEEKTSIIINKKWAKKWMLSHKSPLIGESNEVIGLVGLSIDISKQKRLEQSLLSKTEALSLSLEHKANFLNMLSHEIRSPLHIISSIVEEMKQNISSFSKEEINNILNILSENNKRLIKLLTHLLNSANSARGQIIYNFTDGNIIDTCMACIKEFSCLANISFNLGEVKNVKLAYDEVKIGQMIRNILDNAIKYGKSNIIKINLEESKEPKAIVIKIENTGNNFPEDEKEKVFNSFFQGENAKNQQNGVGLGLSICKEIIAMHKGKIWVDNIDLQTVSVNFSIPYI